MLTRPPPRGPLLFALLALVASLLFVTAPALAHDVPALPRNVTGAVVRVDAYERESLGVVVGDGHLVLVPFAAIEVARPGFPHAFVTDARGTRQPAGVAATDRAAGLALLALPQPVAHATPLVMSPTRMGDAVDNFAIVVEPSSSAPLTDSSWSFYPGGWLQPALRTSSTYPPPIDGSPVVDGQGRLVGLVAHQSFGVRFLDTPDAVVAKLDGSSRERRSVLFYGGGYLPFSFAPDGGLWVGLGGSFGARVRDVAVLRLDAELSGLMPSGQAAKQCSESCFSGVRGVLTPSVGVRLVIGGIGGARAYPIALTPSLGMALGIQAIGSNGPTAYDVATPGAWAQVAPGLSASLWGFELSGRVRLPLDASRSPTVELAIGAFF